MKAGAQLLDRGSVVGNAVVAHVAVPRRVQRLVARRVA